MKYILLAEKPSQAKAYADAFTISKRERTYIELKPCSTFPEGATVTWGIGHLVSLKMPQEYKEEWGKWNLKNLPIIPDEFEFKVSTDKKAQFNTVKKLFNECQTGTKTCLVNCTDIDREGSNIFYSIYNQTGTKNKNIKRLWINSLENDEIRKGFNNLHDNKKDLLMYAEAKTRQVADWLVGINASQLYTLLLQQKGLNTSLSVGRVQSPTVYMIYQRQKEIEEFVPKPFFELFSNFTHSNGEYEGKAKVKEENKEKILSLLEKNDLLDLKSDEAKIKEVSKQLKKEKSPKLHSLSSLQTKANKSWKYSPAKVLEVMQSLYEKKIVSYPRTDCNFITDSEFDYLSSNLEKYQSLLNIKFESKKEKNKRYVDGKKVQEHYAIIPTKNVPNESAIEKLTTEEKNIFYEVLKTTLAMFHKDYEFEETKITTVVKEIDFFTKGKVEVDKGWKELFLSEKEVDYEKKDSITVLPSVEKEDLVVSVLEVKEGVTTPPKAFTEGGLINLMKTAGKMVDDVEDSDILKEIEGIGTEATRSGIIETIKRNDYIEVNKNIVSVTDKGIILCEAIEGSLLSSPSMTAKWESYLKKIGEGNGSQETFLSNIEKFLITTINEAPEKIGTLENIINETNKENEVSSCPSCNGSIEDKGKFYGCSGYRQGCKVTFPKKLAGKTITKSNIKSLCTKKETNKLKGFKSKKGKSFEAKLILNEENQVKFSFD